MTNLILKVLYPFVMFIKIIMVFITKLPEYFKNCHEEISYTSKQYLNNIK